jgi:hypothetical protein
LNGYKPFECIAVEKGELVVLRGSTIFVCGMHIVPIISHHYIRQVHDTGIRRAVATLGLALCNKYRRGAMELGLEKLVTQTLRVSHDGVRE